MGKVAIQVQAPGLWEPRRVIIKDTWTVKTAIDIMIKHFDLVLGDVFELNRNGITLENDLLISDTGIIDGDDIDLLAYGSNV